MPRITIQLFLCVTVGLILYYVVWTNLSQVIQFRPAIHDPHRHQQQDQQNKPHPTHRFHKEARDRPQLYSFNHERRQQGNNLPERGHDLPDQQEHMNYSSAHKHLKKILFWNDAYGDKNFFFGSGQEPFLKANCRVNSCYATGNRTLFHTDELDAVIWHLRANDKSFPRKRSPHTFYVFWMIESASYTYGNVAVYNGIFNWTMTYRLDSDIPRPYGIIQYNKQGQNLSKFRQWNRTASGKGKIAAWFVSNCNTVSAREFLVQSIQKYMDVDVYGRCGKYKCKDRKTERCYEMLARDYKFYLSFENSLCDDYITEKLFRVLGYVVPVVYGLGYERLNLPPKSYINALDFRSVKDLTDYLLYLHNNDTAYDEYLRWTYDDITIDRGFTSNRQPFCDLCERLHDADLNLRGSSSDQVRKPIDDNQADREGDGNKSKNLAQSSSNGISSVDRRLTENNKTKPFVNEMPSTDIAHLKVNIRRTPIIAKEYRKVYNDLHGWFVKDRCVTPYNDVGIASFVHGLPYKEQFKSLPIDMVDAEHSLPYALQPNRVDD
uniref:Fucosyltransferase n=2 Tax=Hirondellea gigas TaxID=1518452 RepID=A0A2P2HYD0_9CRUS